MSDPTILVTACGSSIGLEVAKSLRQAFPQVRMVGTEVSWWGEQIAESICDLVVPLPRGDEATYPAALKALVEKEKIDVAFVNTDPEIDAVAKIRDAISIPLSTPRSDVLPYCLDKRILHELITDEKLVAETCVVADERDLAAAFARLGGPLWLRCPTGPRGRGSIPVEDVNEGVAWMQYWQRRDGANDLWLAHEMLPGRNFNWTSVWWEGKLVTSSTGERLKYFLASVAVSGITGNVSHCSTVDGESVNPIAEQVIRALPGTPHGIFSVDLREDRDGRPRVTEINGRTAFRPLLFTTAGMNTPAIFAQLALDQQPTGIIPQYNAATPGWEMIRGMDMEPMFRGPEA